MPKLYSELAPWWPLLSAPEDYAEEAAFYRGQLEVACEGELKTLLELGSGGGNTASHLKELFLLTLVDVAPGMLAVSRQLNPECEHVEGDMRTVRLGRLFDAVLVHDAVCYMTTPEDLRSAIKTAFVHCRPGGAALFAPDHLKDTFHSATDCGGNDREGRGLRYMEWTWDPDPSDTTYTVDFAYLLRERDGSIRVEHDRHIVGLFSRDEWLGLLSGEGFVSHEVPFTHSDYPGQTFPVFVARKPYHWPNPTHRP